MKPGQVNSKQRSRGRGNNGGGGGGGGGGKKHMGPRGNATFDSTGPEIRVRGNAHQVLDKYLALARDASSQGDRVAAENYYQHAEHYFRVISAQQANQPQNGRPRPHTPSPAEDQNQMMSDMDESGEDGDEGNGNSQEGEAEAVNA